MNLYNSVQKVLGKVLPKNWPWSQGATAKRVVWMVHVLVVVGAAGFTVWLVSLLFSGPGSAETVSPSGEVEPQHSPQPLPLWVRSAKALSPLLTPFLSYAVYHFLPEPDED